MSEMVERVAKAIIENELGVRPDSLDFDCVTDAARDLARACIAALRNPTDKMICAALDAHDRGKRGYSDIWNSMVDGALK